MHVPADLVCMAIQAAGTPSSLKQVQHVIQLGINSQERQAAHFDLADSGAGRFVDHDQLLHQDTAHNVLPVMSWQSQTESLLALMQPEMTWMGH